MTSSHVRIELIKRSYNQERIADIARCDPVWQVRLAAVENIEDESILKDILYHELTSKVAVKAMENINDRQYLCDVCLNHPDSYVRLACINRITDESLLSDEELSLLLEKMLFNDPDLYVLKSVCENPNLTNQEVLTRLAGSSVDETLKRHAIKRITDVNVLADFALNDENPYVRREAISNPNLESLDVICDVILHDSDDFNRVMAIYRIPDMQSLLEIIYKKEFHHRLYEIANNITFDLNDYFLDVLKNESDDYERVVAVNFITDRDILDEIALNESDEDIRSDAIRNRKFINQDILDELMAGQTSPKILMAVISKIQNQELLAGYVKSHLDCSDVTLKAISRLVDLDTLEELSTHPDSKIRFAAVKKISGLRRNDELLLKIALTESIEEICLEAVRAMSITNDLISVADKRLEKTIRMAALAQIQAKPLIDNYTRFIQNSLSDIPFESALRDMAMNDVDEDIRKLATGKIEDKSVLENIASGDDVNRIEAQKRLDALFEDIKWINNELVLNDLAKSSDKDVSAIAKATMEDSKTWKGRMAEINETDDIDALKDIAANDFNYMVRNEAEGKLEKMLFNIRLDEIENDANQQWLKSIVADSGFSSEIRRKALLKIADEEFIGDFEYLL